MTVSVKNTTQIKEELQSYKLSVFLKQFVDKSNKAKYCFILGAGASIQSGIASGQKLAKKWLVEIESWDKEEYDQWIKAESIDINNAGMSYSKIYDKRFQISPKDGFTELEKEMDKKDPSCGYAVLAKLLSEGKHNVVVTTNFDSLMEDALFMYTDKRPLVCSHESLANFITLDSERPIIAKIHRGLFFSPKSNAKDTGILDDQWVPGLKEIFKYYTPIFIGYGGNDGSLMDFLNQIDQLGKAKFIWCYWEKDPNFPSPEIAALIKKHNWTCYI